MAYMYYTKLRKLLGNVPLIFKANGTNVWFLGQIAGALMTACVLKRFERTAGSMGSATRYAAVETSAKAILRWPVCWILCCSCDRFDQTKGWKKLVVFVFVLMGKVATERHSLCWVPHPGQRNSVPKTWKHKQTSADGSLGKGLRCVLLTQAVPPPSHGNSEYCLRVPETQDRTVFKTNCVFNYDALKERERERNEI